MLILTSREGLVLDWLAKLEWALDTTIESKDPLPFFYVGEGRIIRVLGKTYNA